MSLLHRMRLTRHMGWVLPTAGLGVVAWYVQSLGLDRLTRALDTMGGGLAFLLALPLFLFFVHALGWRYTLSPQNRRKIGLLRLFVLQTFSYGISGMLPLQVFVSEPLKMAVLRDTDYDRDDFAASLLVDNTINGFAILAFAAGGLGYLVLTVPTSLVIKLMSLALVGVLVALGLLLVVVEKRGLLAGTLSVLARLPALRARSERHRAGAERVDRAVRGFYEHDRWGFYAAFFCHLLEKAHGVAEFWLIFELLGMEVSWGSCFFVASVVSALDNVLFFVQVGGMEAWVSSLLAWMGLARDSVHITAALFRRLRFLFWAVVALALVPATRRLFTAPASSRGAVAPAAGPPPARGPADERGGG